MLMMCVPLLYVVCSLVEEGVLAIFGPQRRLCTRFVSSIANETQIPHLTTRWSVTSQESGISVNLHPNHHITGRALADLVGYFNWSTFALIYDDAESKCWLSCCKASEEHELT